MAGGGVFLAKGVAGSVLVAVGGNPFLIYGRPAEPQNTCIVFVCDLLMSYQRMTIAHGTKPLFFTTLVLSALDNGKPSEAFFSSVPATGCLTPRTRKFRTPERSRSSKKTTPSATSCECEAVPKTVTREVDAVYMYLCMCGHHI